MDYLAICWNSWMASGSVKYSQLNSLVVTSNPQWSNKLKKVNML